MKGCLPGFIGTLTGLDDLWGSPVLEKRAHGLQAARNGHRTHRHNRVFDNLERRNRLILAITY
jgi:hypothetical protein